MRTLAILLSLLVAVACSPTATTLIAPSLGNAASELVVPAPPGASFPRLSAAGEQLRLSWLQPDPEPGFFVLATAHGDGETWQPPQVVTRSDRLFVNWADFPSVVESADRALVAHWLEKSGPGTYAYDVRMSISRDDGASWDPAFTPHRDGVAAEHGFVSLVPEADGAVTAVWLDGRETVADGPMTLRAAALAPDGTLGDEDVLDARVCDCCQTAAVAAGNDLVAAYRDRSDDEVRDIWSVSRRGSAWDAPVRVAEDGWQIPGCPVNGPALASDGPRVAIAWFALVDGAPEVKVAFSDNAAHSWKAPILVERGVVEAATLGRVDLVWLGSGRVAVSWLTGVGEIGEIRVRTVDATGELGPVIVVGTTTSSRSSGFPRMLRQDDRLVFAWTEPGEPNAVRLAALPLLADD